MDKLRHKLRQQEEEVTKLRSEVKVHQDKEATMSSLTKSKSILSEINEECRRTAAVISTTPIKLNISRLGNFLQSSAIYYTKTLDTIGIKLSNTSLLS